MAFGLRTINDAGFVQIDEEYRNLHVVGTGTGSSSPSGNFNTVAFTSISDCVPLVFARPSSGVEVGGFYLIQEYASGTFTPGPPFARFVYEATGAFEWVLCSLTGGGSPAGDYGMQVFDSAGNVAFDSRRQYPQIRSVHGLTSGGAASIDLTVPAEADWFLLNHLGYNNFVGEFGPFRGLSGKRVSSTVLRIRCYDFDIHGGNYSSFDAQSSPLTVMTALI
jgi:hypothetical protein